MYTIKIDGIGEYPSSETYKSKKFFFGGILQEWKHTTYFEYSGQSVTVDTFSLFKDGVKVGFRIFPHSVNLCSGDSMTIEWDCSVKDRRGKREIRT